MFLRALCPLKHCTGRSNLHASPENRHRSRQAGLEVRLGPHDLSNMWMIQSVGTESLCLSQSTAQFVSGKKYARVANTSWRPPPMDMGHSRLEASWWATVAHSLPLPTFLLSYTEAQLNAFACICRSNTPNWEENTPPQAHDKRAQHAYTTMTTRQKSLDDTLDPF